MAYMMVAVPVSFGGYSDTGVQTALLFLFTYLEFWGDGRAFSGYFDQSRHDALTKGLGASQPARGRCRGVHRKPREEEIRT